MCMTMQPMTSPTGSSPTRARAAAAGAESSEVRTRCSAARRTRAAATGGRPRPSHSVMDDVRRPSAVDEAGDPVGDDRRLVLAVDLDGDRADDLQVARVLEVGGLQDARGADA